MYNATTVLSVDFGYALVYLVLLIEAAVFIPASILEFRLHTSVGPLNYFASAQVAASIGTLVGAIGAGLENTETVHRATFGWRQYVRHQEYEEMDRAQEESEHPGTDQLLGS